MKPIYIFEIQNDNIAKLRKVQPNWWLIENKTNASNVEHVRQCCLRWGYRNRCGSLEYFVYEDTPSSILNSCKKLYEEGKYGIL